MAAFAPKTSEGGEDTIWAHQDPLHSENIMHPAHCLWRLGDGVTALIPLREQSGDDWETK